MNFEKQPVPNKKEEERVIQSLEEVRESFKNMSLEDKQEFFMELAGDSKFMQTFPRKEKPIGRDISDEKDIGPTPPYRDFLNSRKDGF